MLPTPSSPLGTPLLFKRCNQVWNLSKILDRLPSRLLLAHSLHKELGPSFVATFPEQPLHKLADTAIREDNVVGP